MTVLLRQLADYYRETGNTFQDLRDIIGVPGREEPFETLVVRAVERGELEAMPRIGRLVQLPLDLLRQDMLMRGGPASDHALVEIVDQIWLPLLRR